MADYSLKRPSSSWNLANYNISIIGVAVGVADKAARTEGESISESWHGVEAREIDCLLYLHSALRIKSTVTPQVYHEPHIHRLYKYAINMQSINQSGP